jgi:hypothetical protein
MSQTVKINIESIIDKTIDSIDLSNSAVEPEVIAESVIESPTRTISESEYDEIIHEWFYRLPKGFAESPYTDAEYAVLNEIMVERGYDPLTSSVMQLQLELSAIDDVEEDEAILSEAVMTKDELIDIIRSTELPDQVLQYIARQIDSLSSEAGVIEILKEKGYDDQHSKRIFDKAVELDSYNELRDYLTNPKKAIPFSKLGISGNLNSILPRVGLSDAFVDWLFTFKPTIGGVNSGNAENLLRVILKGGHIPNKGDVGTDKFDVEMKTSKKDSGFRFTGQSGYGTGLEVSTFMFEAIARLYGKDLPEDFPDLKGKNDTRLQLYYDANKESLADTYIKDLIKRKKITKNQVAKLYAAALQRAYKNYNGDMLGDVILPSIDNFGKLNTKEFFPRLAALEFRYYADAEEWGALMAVNEKRDYIIFDKNATIEELAKIFKTRFKLSAPNTKPKATVQDSRVGIEYRG